MYALYSQSVYAYCLLVNIMPGLTAPGYISGTDMIIEKSIKQTKLKKKTKKNIHKLFYYNLDLRRDEDKTNGISPPPLCKQPEDGMMDI